EALTTKRPALIVARTCIGYGAPNKQNTPACHGAALGQEEVRAAKEAAGWPLEPTFLVPDEAYEPFRKRREENLREYRAWHDKVSSLDSARKATFDALSKRTTPADLLEQLAALANGKADATRNHAGRVQQKVAELVPHLVGGSADLAGSVKTLIKGAADVGPG